MKNVSESLAGRVGIVNLLGLSDAEIYHEPSEPFQTEGGFCKGISGIWHRSRMKCSFTIL